MDDKQKLIEAKARYESSLREYEGWKRIMEKDKAAYLKLLPPSGTDGLRDLVAQVEHNLASGRRW